MRVPPERPGHPAEELLRETTGMVWEQLIARVEIARGRSSAHGNKLRRQLRKDLRILDRQTHPWARPWTRLIKAGLASTEGSKSAAADHLVAAAAGFESQNLELYAAVSRRRRGQLLGPERGGESFVEEADRAMTELGFEEPARMADVCAPGVWD